MAKNPYQSLPNSAFWRTGVASRNPLHLQNLYKKKFTIAPTDKIATAGSCFAQHIGMRLARNQFNYCDFEPAPAELPHVLRRKFGYGIYSARYGNVYTIQQFSQLFDRAHGIFTPTERFWEHEGRYIDPFRPTIEPDGFASLAEFDAMQNYHFECVRTMFKSVDILIFTLGLTEAWVNLQDGSVYPICPGTIAGEFDETKYAFHNYSATEILAETNQMMEKISKINPAIKYILTVSPVPLTATASNDHVLVATTYSKSVLRAVAGELAASSDNIDYFPSYEIIASHPVRAMFYDPNLRTVASRGVDHVMRYFFNQHLPEKAANNAPKEKSDDADIDCDEELLEMEQKR